MIEFLKIRIIDVIPNVAEILELIRSQRGGCYHEEIIINSNYSDALVRPALYSLYSAGFLDRNIKGKMKFYLLNENGEKLLDLIKGGNKNEKN